MSLRMTVAALLLAAGGLTAAEVKGELALVPGSARVVVSIRPADIWEGELGKEARKALGKDVKLFVQELEKPFGVGPEGLERVTMFVTSLGPREDLAFVLKFKKKVDAREILGKVAPGAKIEKVAGVEVFTNPNTSAYVKDDTVLVLGTPRAVKDTLTSGEKHPEGLKAAITLVLNGKHSAVGYFDGRIIPEQEKRRVPPAMAMFRPLLNMKEAVGWADVGLTTRMGGRLSFASEDTAKKGEKTVKALKAAAEATLAGLSDDLSKLPKEIGELVSMAEKALEGATIKRDGASIQVGMSVAVGKGPFLAGLKQAVDRARLAAARARSQNNLKQIGLAMHAYHDATGALPPQAVYSKTGKPLLSWRVLILPYIEQDALYKKFKLDEPWDSPHNKKLIPLMPPVYKPVWGKASNQYGTFYQVFFGKAAMFEGKRGVRLVDIADGTSNTIMAAEAGKDVIWTKPDDIPFDEGKKLPKLGGLFQNGFNVVMGDGSVRFVVNSIAAETLKALITRAGGEVVGGDF